MGNAQSAASPRGQNRLSKPRTNINKSASTTQLSVATAFKKTISNPIPSTSTVFEISPDQPPLSQQLNDQIYGIHNPSYSHLRSSVFDYSPAGDNVNGDLEPIPEPARDEPDAYNMSPYVSRTSSMASLQYGSRCSTMYFNKPRFSLAMSVRNPDIEVEEHVDDLEGEAPAGEISNSDTALLRDAEQESRDYLRPLPHQDSAAMIRRRSLATTPGLATRNPIPSARQNFSLRKEMARLSVPEAPVWMREKALPSPSLPVPMLAPPTFRSGSPLARAETPADLDYTHLGALKLGSLVVTNGHASPDPKSTSEGNDYFSSKAESKSAAAEPADVGSNPKSQKLLHRKTWSPGLLEPSSGVHDLIDFSYLYSSDLKDSKNDQPKNQHNTTGSHIFKNTLQFKPDNMTGDHMGTGRAPETLVSPRTVVHDDRPKDMVEICDTDLTGEEALTIEDEATVSEQETKIFRDETLRILDGSMFSDESQPRSEETSRPSTISEPSLKKSTRPVQAKSDSGYCSEYSVNAFSRNSSAKSRESDKAEKRSNASSTSVAIDKVKRPDLLKDLATERMKQQDEAPKVAARRKSSGFLRLRAKSWREMASPSQPSLKTNIGEVQTDKPQQATVANETMLGPRKLQKRNPALHQSFIIVSSAGRSPLSSSNSSVDNLPRSTLKDRSKSQLDVSLVEERGNKGRKDSFKREHSTLRPLFLRSKSAPNTNEPEPESHCPSIPNTRSATGENFAKRMNKKKSLDLQVKPMRQHSDRKDSAHVLSEPIMVPSVSAASSKKPAAYASSLRSVEPETVLPRSKSTGEIQTVTKANSLTLVSRQNAPTYPSSVQPIMANDTGKALPSDTRDHRFALDVPPVPSIPVLSKQKSALGALNGRNEGLFTAKVAQSATPIVILSDRGLPGCKNLTEKKSREELARFVAQASQQPPSPSKRRFYKEVRDHQDERRRSLGDGLRQTPRSIRSRKSLGSISDRRPGGLDRPEMPISLRA